MGHQRIQRPELTRTLGAAPRSDAVTLLTRKDGKQWGLDHFSQAFGDAVKLAARTG
jgi:hypothetical protein